MVYLHGASISHRVRRSIYKRLGFMVANILQGKKFITDAFRGYLHGASIPYRVRLSLQMRLGGIAWCFKISQGKMIIVDAFRGYWAGASISQRQKSL